MQNYFSLPCLLKRIRWKSGGRAPHPRRSIARIEVLESRELLAAQVTLIPAPSNVEFVDMGYDSDTDEVGIVGYVVDGVEKTATVFELNATEDGFEGATLADLPGARGKARVFGISSEASRIAGDSVSPARPSHQITGQI